MNSYKLSKGGMCMSSYYVYVIAIPTYDWEVEKRYTELLWLHDTLKK